MLRAAPVLSVSSVLVLAAAFADDPACRQQALPPFTVSKETTRITEPLTADGWPDYFGALNHRYGEGVTPENNAVVLFYRAFGPVPGGIEQPDRFFELLGMPKPAADGAYFLDLETWLRNSAGLAPEDAEYQNAVEQQARAISRPWSAQQFPQIADWLRSNEKPLALLLEGTRRPRYFSPLVGSPGDLLAVLQPGVHQTRFAARALCARAMLRLSNGQTEAAWNDIVACRRLGRLTAQGATMIECLVGIAIDSITTAAGLALIEHTQPDARTVERYLAELDRLPSLSRVVDRIDLGERYAYLDAVTIIARGDQAAMVDMLMELIGPEDFAGKLLVRLSLAATDWDVVLRMGNEWYDRIAAALRNPDRERREAAVVAVSDALREFAGQIRDAEALDKLAADANNPREAASQIVGRVLVGLLLPAFRQFAIAADTAEQKNRNLRVALALAAYRSDHGRYPAKLNELAPRYLASVPSDLFASKPLIYRPHEDGYVLYSVGPNGTDDGGIDDGPRGDDIVVRMPSRVE